MLILISIIILVVTLIIGVPIPFSFGACVIFLTATLGLSPDFLLPVGYSKQGSVVLLAIPLFILAGGIMEKGQIGGALVNLVEKFTGRIKGNLAIVAIVTSAIFGAISGSAAATLSCIGAIMFPRMEKAGYPKGTTAAIIANASPLGLLIPPSSAQILFAWAGNQSVLACFLSTIIPGIMLTTLLCVVSYFMLRKEPDIQIAPKETVSEWTQDLKVKSKRAVPALLMPIIILGGIYGGFMTPTEAAAVAVFYAVPVGLYVYKKMKAKDLKGILVETATTTGVVMVMFFVVMMLSRIYVMQDLQSIVMNILTSISPNKYTILLLINIFMIIIGMLMDDVSGILLCTPILLPVVTALGVHPVHFAAILGVNLGMGNITPPTAPLLYLGARLGKAKVNNMLKPAMLLILFAWLPTLLITTYFPEVALFIPKLILHI
ncbi:MAG: TRAP transporter large permease [Pseudomonadota bacterium]